MPSPWVWQCVALSNMVEIIPKPIKKIPKRQRVLTYFPILILILAIAISFLLFSLEKEAQITLQGLDEKISKARTPEVVSLEKEILTYQKKINNFSQIIKRHFFSSKIFPFLEERTHQNTLFQKFDLIPGENRIKLVGQTDNFLILHQQVSIFQADPLIRELNLSKVSIGREGKIEFDLEVIFDPKILKSR